MTGDRERMAPEMTPLVDPGSKTQPAEGGRDEAADGGQEPGLTPGLGGAGVVGASRGGDPDSGPGKADANADPDTEQPRRA
jgi:hypothetical protein